MKKILTYTLCFLVACTSVFMLSCKKGLDLFTNLSELRNGVYAGESSNFSLKAISGFKEKPQVLDGKVGETEYYLTFILNENNINATYNISFELDKTSYSANFAVSPMTYNLETTFNIKSVPDSFEVVVKKADINEKINLISQIPETAKNYKAALNSLTISQPDLINKYIVGGVFSGEIALRVIAQSEKIYYYIGITDTQSKTVAFLVDGVSLEVLAIKNIF